MDIAVGFYLTKQIELQEKNKEKNISFTTIRESCINCGQQSYWCQCKTQSNITRIVRSYSYSSDSSD
jgi:hypothetical protein